MVMSLSRKMMMMMDYGSQFTGSTLSSDTMSGSVGSVQPSVRTVRLVRPNTGSLPPPNIIARHGPNLGFSVRGGREHGTGFYVSLVEPGSEAHRQGLKVCFDCSYQVDNTINVALNSVCNAVQRNFAVV
ncbi:hypothetical protein FQR65_LT06251 [Abscondita terminalis]|nr:hypothetical protein FQR65_LT06251 [Abscondita terminalis]